LTMPGALVPGCLYFCFLPESALALKSLAPKLACPALPRSAFQNLVAGRSRFLSMMLHVLLCRFRSVMRSMVQVTLRRMRVVRCHFVIAGFVVRRRFTMVPSRMLMMLRRFVMMLCRLLGHESSLSIWINRAEVGWTGRR
jgi:hypothetical protein